MKPIAIFLVSAALAVAASGPAAAENPRIEQVAFAAGADSAVVTDSIVGDEIVLYKLNARDGQFLQVSLRPNNQSAHFNIYIPGRGPGDEALFNSDLGGTREYTGQLYKTGDHTVSVFLNRNAAREGQEAKYDIVFRVTAEKPGRLPAEVPTSSAPSTAATSPITAASPGDAWKKVSVETRSHAPLLERQAALSPEFAKNPVTVALLVLEADLTGVVTTASAVYDTMENPAEVELTVTEGGILDDDLLGVRHVVSLARNRNDEWHVVGYARGDLRRAHLQ